MKHESLRDVGGEDNKMSIIFKTFRTYAHPYVYDRHTNAVVMLTEDEYKELVAVEKGELDEEESAVIKRYQEQGLFQPNVVQKIEHPSTLRMEPYLKKRMQQLTLQVTQQCNLRCEYCAYSGIYEKNRTHNSARMEFDTAKKAIDLFLKNCTDRDRVTIGFYGGEPLLELPLIKRCVAYANSKVEGKKIAFNMTTNGTLLSDEVVDYLVENDFQLSISLDGSKEEHDRSRKFKDGTGSFDVIIRNVRRICERYPAFHRRILFMTTINPHMDIGCVMEYFSTEDIFDDRNIVFNTMNEHGLKESTEYEKDYYRIRNFEYIKLMLSLVGMVNEECVSPLVVRSKSTLERLRKDTRHRYELFPVAHHSGPCLPGVRKLFVRTDGKLYPCERVNEMQDYFCIGSVDDGVEETCAKRILNVGTVTEKLCKNCWALRQCSMCAGQIEFDGELTLNNKIVECERSKQQAIFNLVEYCVLSEYGIDLEKLR